MGYTSAVRKCIQIEIDKRYNLIHQKEWTGEPVSIICKRYGTSRKSYYKWKNRYKEKGIEGLLDNSRRPHNIKYMKVTSEIQETILDLRLTKRFGCNRIKFRLRRTIGLSLSTRTIYKILKRHGLNILKCQYRRRGYKRFNQRFLGYAAVNNFETKSQRNTYLWSMKLFFKLNEDYQYSLHCSMHY